ncbi:MAG: agmatinase [Rhodospirillaceae bacterium]|jgi:guanidinopropionase|nr:agmatinase [Rhodospirillaceae bacterium]MBT4043606.1 agmatinase [Rhodospirillaceae bacterium]MBT4687430.1 agmatinase [Rhodospirillaceae bacterium]MBT5079670.1 agmatinase [Rhodospirillaceae bacterium]MBT5527169.1 agmatinase [Rhodospirillaceae bacterium]
MSKDAPADDPMLRPRYTGLASFMRAPYRDHDWSGVEIGMIGVPYDGGVTNRPGARHGPREIRNQSSLIRRINQATGVCPYDLCQVADLGDAWIEKPYELEGALDEIAAFFGDVHDRGITPLSAGGDHSVTLPILRAVARDRPLGLVHFDAHCDTGDDYLGSKFHHGAPFRRAVEEGLLDPKRCIQIGIRGSLNDMDLWSFSHDQGMRVIYIEEFYELGVKGVIAEAQRVVGTGPAYLSFDVDGLDPVYAPGTGTPEVGGFSTLEAQLMLRGLAGLNFVGGDVVEVSPPFDPSGNTALVGATMMFEILCLLAQSRVARVARV